MDDKTLKENLNKYKYISPRLSLLERVFLNQWWENCSQFYPMWLAPNCITLIGTVAVSSAFLLMLYFSPNMDGECPRWWSILTAICCFIYQTMDGSDGKQARRTKSGSAMGEIFDHACDAVVTTMYCLITSELLGVGLDQPIVGFACISGGIAFVCSNYVLLHKGKQLFSDLDCQECQVLIQTLLVITFILGEQAHWAQVTVPFPYFLTHFIKQIFPPALLTTGSQQHPVDGNWEVRWLLFAATGVMALLNSVLYALDIIKWYTWDTPADPKYVRTHSATKNNLRGFRNQIVTVIFWFFLGWVGYTRALKLYDDETAKENGTKSGVLIAWMVVVMFGVADIANRTLIWRVARIPFPDAWVNGSLWTMGAFIAWVSYAPPAYANLGRALIALFAIFRHMFFVTSVGNRICKALGIYFLSITKKRNN